MKHPTTQRNWFGRNWKWAVPMSVFFALSATALGVLYPYLCKRCAYKDCPAYRMALTAVQDDPAVREKIGTPIRDISRVPSGVLEENGERGRATFVFSVRGPDGEADVQAQARKVDGQWGLALLNVTCNDGVKLVVSTAGEGDAPKFQPTPTKIEVASRPVIKDVKLPVPGLVSDGPAKPAAGPGLDLKFDLPQ